MTVNEWLGKEYEEGYAFLKVYGSKEEYISMVIKKLLAEGIFDDIIKDKNNYKTRNNKNVIDLGNLEVDIE